MPWNFDDFVREISETTELNPEELLRAIGYLDALEVEIEAGDLDSISELVAAFDCLKGLKEDVLQKNLSVAAVKKRTSELMGCLSWQKKKSGGA